MSQYKAAISLVEMGFYVFPLKENGKTPSIKNFTELSTNDPNELKKWWVDSVMQKEHYYNVGVITSKFKDGKALLVIDIDNGDNKKGDETILKLELEGKILPKTLTQKTPSGGFHLIYLIDKPVKQGVNVLGPGVDIRSRGGYILAAGSEINGKFYTIDNHPITPAPQWVIDICNKNKVKERVLKDEIKVNQNVAKKKAKHYLLMDAPPAIEGQGGDTTTFKVTARLKDFGLTIENCLKMLVEFYNKRCQPPWPIPDLEIKVNNAYQFGQNTTGIDSPEADFAPVKEKPKKEKAVKKTPINKLNEKYAFIVLGGRSTILEHNKKDVRYMNPQAFHDLLKSETIYCADGKLRQLSELWFSSNDRATYRYAEMLPCQDAPKDVFNLWRGFTCEPLKKDEKPTDKMIEGVNLFKEHALINVCDNDIELYKWLFGYFAHMIQKPWQKPLTALVFKGEKGVGKNALIDRIGNLLGVHYKLTSSKRYVTGNFNSHLTNLLLFVLDEAFWSGDKQAEGILKDLITGNTHLIEHKGKDVVTVKNILRLCIIGNEDWLVPATQDERRYAVFSVGTSRQGDKPFFTKMRKLLNKGGNRLLLTELLNYDISKVDVNSAPNTKGLLEQKIESLNPIHSWWYSSLREGMILELEFANEWPTDFISKKQLRDAFSIYVKKRGINYWLPDAARFGKLFNKCIKGMPESAIVQRGMSKQHGYVLPSIEMCRGYFDAFIGHPSDWDDKIN